MEIKLLGVSVESEYYVIFIRIFAGKQSIYLFYFFKSYLFNFFIKKKYINE